MNDEIKELLGKALPPSPPTAMDGDTAVADGRRRLGRRRYAAGGGALAGVAAVAVAISLAMNTVGGNGGIPGTNAGGSPSASASEEPPPQDGVRPELDPNKEYFWYRNVVGPQTDETRVLTERLWTWLAETYDVQAPAVKAEFLKETAVLTEHVKDGAGGSDLDETRPVGYEVPLLTLQTPSYADRNGIEIPAADDAIDYLTVQVWPAGGFSRPEVPTHEGPPDLEMPSPGVSSFWELARCSDYELTVQLGHKIGYAPDCDTAMDDSALKFTTRVTPEEGDPFMWSRAVYYTEDGTAIVLSDTTEEKEGEGSVLEPTIDADALLDLAVALAGD